MWLWSLCLLCVVEIHHVEYVATAPGSRRNSKGGNKNENCRKLKFEVRMYQDNEGVRVFVGSDFKFDCRVIGLPEPNVTWTRDDKPLKEVSYRTFGLAKLEKVFVLHLKNLLVADAGRYKCTADNGECKAISKSVRLVVSEKARTEIPKIKELVPLTTKTHVGKSVTFTCIVQKFEDFTPFIKWVRYRSFKSEPTIIENGKGTNMSSLRSSFSSSVTTTTTTTTVAKPTTTTSKFLSVERMSSTRDVIGGVVYETTDLKLETGHRSTLHIPSTSRSDTGVYSCVAFNEVGFDKVDSHLLVQPLPDPSKEELERLYIEKYGTSIKLPFSLATVVVIPVCLLIILIIGCVWWQSNQERLEDERRDFEKQKQMEELIIDEKKALPSATPIVSLQSTSSDSANGGYSRYQPKQNKCSTNYHTEDTEVSLQNMNAGKGSASMEGMDEHAKLLNSEVIQEDDDSRC